MRRFRLSRCLDKSLKVLILALILSLLTQTTFAQSQTEEIKTVDADGFAVVFEGNTVIARDAAVDDALRKGVEQAVGTYVSSETMVESYQVLNDNVYTKTQGYVKDYKVMSESKVNNVYKVTVRASVAVGSIKNDLDALGLMHLKAEKPRVLFIVVEHALGDSRYTLSRLGKSDVSLPTAETALKEIFINKGFNVVDISGSSDRIGIRFVKPAELTNERMSEMAGKLNAEIVIKVRAEVRQGVRMAGSAVGSYHAEISADAVRVDDAGVVASARGQGTARHISDVTGGTDAIGRASEEVAGKLIDQIIIRWTRPSTVVIRITGVTDYKKLTAFKNRLKKEIRGVQAVFQRKFEGAEVVFELETKVSAQTVADEMERFSGSPVKVVGTTQNTIEAVMEGAGTTDGAGRQ